MVITIYFLILHVLHTQNLIVCNWLRHEQLKLLWKLQVVRVYLVCKKGYFLLSTQLLANTFLCIFTHFKASALYLFSKRILIARSASHLLENWMTPMSFPLSSANLISPASRNLSFSCCHVAEGGSYRQ